MDKYYTCPKCPGDEFLGRSRMEQHWALNPEHQMKSTKLPRKAPDGKVYRCHPCRLNFSGAVALKKHFQKYPTHRTRIQHDRFIRNLDMRWRQCNA
jgi:hypothetical protein